MKSEKAREFIDGCINNLTVDMPDHVEMRLRLAMTHTAELAEQEAEERMRERAIEAHRKVCFFRNFKDNTCANTATPCGEHSCYYMNYIVQKLTEL